MTWWGPAQVLGFVRAAGFDQTQSRTAVAVAMATSDGADHHRWNPSDTPGIDQRGLFGIDASRVPAEDAHTLYSPTENAEWARALFLHYGSGWNWHPVYRASRGALIKAILMALDTDRGWVNRPATFYSRTRQIVRPWAASDWPRPITSAPGDQSPAEQGELWPLTTP